MGLGKNLPNKLQEMGRKHLSPLFFLGVAYFSVGLSLVL